MAAGEKEKEKPGKPKKEKEAKPAERKDKTESKKKEKDKSGVTEEESGEEAPMQGIGELLPLGEKNVGVKAPTYMDGQLKSLFAARSLTRESEQILFIESLEMHRYGKTLSSQLSVTSPEARYFMESKLLFSEQRSRVQRSDFTLEGDELTFDNERQRGKMVGNVVMEINSPETKKPASPPPPATAAKRPPSPASATAAQLVPPAAPRLPTQNGAASAPSFSSP